MSEIRAQGLCKTFPGHFWQRPTPALSGFDLELRAGEIFGLLGPNGSGKTTAIKLLTGLLHPTAGQAWIRGVPVSDPKSRYALGFLPEGTFFHDHLTGREFLDFHASLLLLPRKQRRERADALLARIGIAHAADQPLRRYSKGMRQRLGLAQALIGDPAVLVLDEPMSGLDPIGRKEVRDLILELRGAGKTILFSSHILADAEMICDQVAILVRGRSVQQGYLDELLGRELSGVELVVEGISESLCEALAADAARFVAQGARFQFDFSCESEAEKALDRVRSSGGRVRSLVPRRKSLEDLLLADVRKERGS